MASSRVGPAPPASAEPFAPLRADLEIVKADCLPSGAPSWILRDPATDALLRLGAREVAVLARWDAGGADDVAAAVRRETLIRCTPEEVKAFAGVLLEAGLLKPGAAALMKISRRRAQAKATAVARLNGVLFPRFTLFDPEPVLDRSRWLVAPVFTRWFWVALAFVFAAALAVVLRKPGEFAASFTAVLGPESLAAITAVVVLAKVCHELGHGYTARQFGVRVPRMGIAFMMLWPMPFTDTTAAYRLPSRWARALIALGGVGAELILATAALAVWVLLAPGPLRDVAGFTATSLMLMTLLVNANPLMRFDGYFVATDVVGMDNLQPRAFEVVRWHLRRWLAAAATPYPEPSLRRVERLWLALYGAAAAVYRVLLYVGIAYAVTAMLFPSLAIATAAAVLVAYIFAPVGREIVMLIRLARRSRWYQGPLRLALVAALLVGLVWVPFSSTISAPVVVEGGESFEVFAPEPSRVEAILAEEGREVRAGEALLRLRSPDVESLLERARLRLGGLASQLERVSTSAERLSDLPVLEREVGTARAEVAQLESRVERLTVVAPTGGLVVMRDRLFEPGGWARADQPILKVMRSGGARARAYVDERDIADVEVGARARFWLEGVPDVVHDGRVTAIHRHRVPALDEPQLAAAAGGPVVSRPGDRGTLIPEQSLFKVEIDLERADTALSRPLKIRGYAVIDTPPRPLARRIWNRIVGLWRREIGITI